MRKIRDAARMADGTEQGHQLGTVNGVGERTVRRKGCVAALNNPCECDIPLLS